MGKSERFGGQESLHRASGPTDYLHMATLLVKMHKVWYEVCVRERKTILYYIQGTFTVI